MAFPVTLNGRTYTLADFSGTNYVDGFPDALEDFVTQAGNIYTTTSTSSVAIGTGSKTFTVADSGKPYAVGTPLRLADAAAPATNWIDGIVTSYSGTTLVVNAVAYAGSGTKASWNINIGGGPIAYTGTLPIAQGGTGATTAADARTNLDTYSKAEADSRFLNVSGEASNVTMTGNVTIGDAGTDTLTVNATATMSDATLTTADINGGTIDGTVIGGSTPAAISGTTGSFSGNLTVDTNTLFVDAANNRVGVATSSPAYRLDVATIGGAIARFINGSSGGTPSTTHGELIVESGEASMGVQLLGTSTSNQKILFGDTVSSAAGQIAYDHSSDYMALFTSEAERLRIDSSGNVGIGTSSPVSALDVTGTVTADGLTVDGNATISSASPTLLLEDTVGAAQEDARIQASASLFSIRRDSDGAARISIGLTTGDIFFYEDTGTTPKFLWDASAEAVLIGTTTAGASILRVVGLPTSSAGLSSGDIWNDAGTLKIV